MQYIFSLGRCKCFDHPCASTECITGERCVAMAYRDALTEEVRYSAECRIGKLNIRYSFCLIDFHTNVINMMCLKQQIRVDRVRRRARARRRRASAGASATTTRTAWAWASAARAAAAGCASRPPRPPASRRGHTRARPVRALRRCTYIN